MGAVDHLVPEGRVLLTTDATEQGRGGGFCVTRGCSSLHHCTASLHHPAPPLDHSLPARGLSYSASLTAPSLPCTSHSPVSRCRQLPPRAAPLRLRTVPRCTVRLAHNCTALYTLHGTLQLCTALHRTAHYQVSLNLFSRSSGCAAETDPALTSPTDQTDTIAFACYRSLFVSLCLHGVCLFVMNAC